MTYRTRIKYTAEQKAEMWDRWQRGESLTSIGRAFDRYSSSIFGLLAPSGGIRPPARQRSSLALTLSEREEISRCIVSELTLRAIATHLGRSPSTISREISRNGGLKHYRASQADQDAWAIRIISHIYFYPKNNSFFLNWKPLSLIQFGGICGVYIILC